MKLLILLIVAMLVILLIKKRKKQIVYGNTMDYYIPGSLSDNFEPTDPEKQNPSICQECGAVISEDTKNCPKCKK